MQNAAQAYAKVAKQIVNPRELEADLLLKAASRLQTIVDNQVTVLQARRPDESAIATVVGFGCHPVTTGYDMYVYSSDFPGPLRDVVATRPPTRAAIARNQASTKRAPRNARLRASGIAIAISAPRRLAFPRLPSGR